MRGNNKSLRILMLSFCLPWLLVLFLYQFELSERLLPLDWQVATYTASTIISFYIGLCMRLSSKKRIDELALNKNQFFEFLWSTQVRRGIRYLSIFLVMMLMVEVVYFKNLPIISSLGVGPEIRYTDFGFKGLHGLFNAIYLIIANIIFLQWINQSAKVSKIKTAANAFIFMLWPILLEARQLLLSLIIQLTISYLLIRGISFGRFLKLLMIFLFVILLFGYIGDIRTGRDGLLNVAQPTFDYPEYLPSGLLWVYIYICSPFNNVVNNYHLVKPNYLPINTISSFFPSTISEDVKNLLGGNRYAWDLVYEILNVSSIHEKLLLDFGPYLSVIIFFILGIVIKWFWIRRFVGVRYYISVVVIGHGLALSIFGDFIFNLVFFSQMVMSALLFDNIKSAGNIRSTEIKKIS